MTAPTFILVGGRLTREDGEALDSRQPVEGDPRSTVTCRILSESLAWWMTTLSLVNAILDSQGPDAFALVIGRQSVVELKPDGSLRRIRLRSLLEGDVGTVHVHTFESEASLPENYVKVGEWQTADHVPNLVVGVELDSEAHRWRFLKGAATSVDAHSTIGQKVVANTTSHFSAYSYSTYEQLAGGLIHVVPHTHGTESYLRGLTEWVRRGRPPSGQFDHWMRDGRLPEGLMPPTPGAAVVADAEFGVTGLYRDGQWQDPAGLEAARAFVESRFDLRIGIWDLADNAALRRSLLKPRAMAPAPTKKATAPKGSARHSARLESARKALNERQVELIHTISQHFKSLASEKWEVLEPLP